MAGFTPVKLSGSVIVEEPSASGFTTARAAGVLEPEETFQAKSPRLPAQITASEVSAGLQPQNPFLFPQTAPRASRLRLDGANNSNVTEVGYNSRYGSTNESAGGLPPITPENPQMNHNVNRGIETLSNVSNNNSSAPVADTLLTGPVPHSTNLAPNLPELSTDFGQGISKNQLPTSRPLPEVPVLHPTMSEYANAVQYLEHARREFGSRFGAVKIVPPSEWWPPLHLDVDSVWFNATRRVYNGSLDADQREFMKALALLHDRILQRPLRKLPVVDGRPVNLFAFYRAVQLRGGIAEVSRGKLWAQIGRDLGFAGKIASSLSTTLRAMYQRILEPFDIYFHERNVQINSSWDLPRFSVSADAGINVDVNSVPFSGVSEEEYSEQLPWYNLRHFEVKTHRILELEYPPDGRRPPPVDLERDFWAAYFNRHIDVEVAESLHHTVFDKNDRDQWNFWRLPFLSGSLSRYSNGDAPHPVMDILSIFAAREWVHHEHTQVWLGCRAAPRTWYVVADTLDATKNLASDARIVPGAHYTDVGPGELLVVFSGAHTFQWSHGPSVFERVDVDLVADWGVPRDLMVSALEYAHDEQTVNTAAGRLFTSDQDKDSFSQGELEKLYSEAQARLDTEGSGARWWRHTVEKMLTTASETSSESYYDILDSLRHLVSRAPSDIVSRGHAHWLARILSQVDNWMVRYNTLLGEGGHKKVRREDIVSLSTMAIELEPCVNQELIQKVNVMLQDADEFANETRQFFADPPYSSVSELISRLTELEERGSNLQIISGDLDQIKRAKALVVFSRDAQRILQDGQPSLEDMQWCVDTMRTLGVPADTKVSQSVNAVLETMRMSMMVLPQFLAEPDILKDDVPRLQSLLRTLPLSEEQKNEINWRIARHKALLNVGNPDINQRPYARDLVGLKIMPPPASIGLRELAGWLGASSNINWGMIAAQLDRMITGQPPIENAFGNFRIPLTTIGLLCGQAVNLSIVPNEIQRILIIKRQLERVGHTKTPGELAYYGFE